MNRRNFIKSTLLFGFISSLAGVSSNVIAKAVEGSKKLLRKDLTFVSEGKLGYKKVSPKANLQRFCDNCSYYKKTDLLVENCSDEDKTLSACTEGDTTVGHCILPAMLNAMKSKEVWVESKGHCNMWKKLV